MKLITATLVAIALSLCAQRYALAADSSFLGKWRFNPDKSQLTGLTYTVEDAGNGQYTFVFGDDKETLGFDGKEHLTKYGNTWSITPMGPNAWKWVQKRNGKVFSDAAWNVAGDGATSTYVNTETHPDGSTSRDEIKLKRTSGTSGLVGSWVGTEMKVGTPTVMQIAAWQGAGYSIKSPAYQSQTDFKLDGRDYTPKGPRVAKGTTLSAKAMGGDQMALTYKLKGKVTETDAWQLSSDGKTLTQTIKFAGEEKPEIDVFDRL